MTGPHDALFKYTFSQPEHAAQLIRGNLPAPIAEQIDWSSLERVPESFVDEKLSWRYTDILFRTNLSGRETLIYLLIEHQSTSEPLMALRLLGYMVRIWEHVIEKDENAKQVPAIIPLVLYHGKQGWKAPMGFLDLIDLGDDIKQSVAPFLPGFSYILDDLILLC
jgi:predicted transposase/invertase (TIGR01784 family)